MIFHSYVKLPEGNRRFPLERDQDMSSLDQDMPPFLFDITPIQHGHCLIQRCLKVLMSANEALVIGLLYRGYTQTFQMKMCAGNANVKHPGGLIRS